MPGKSPGVVDYLEGFDGIVRTLDCESPCYLIRFKGKDGIATFRLLNAREAAFCEVLENAGYHGRVVKIIISRCILDCVPLEKMSAGALHAIISIILSWSGIGVDFDSINERIRVEYARISTARGILESVAMRGFPYTIEQLKSLDLATLIRAASYTSFIFGKEPLQIEPPKPKVNRGIDFDAENRAITEGRTPSPGELNQEHQKRMELIQEQRKMRRRYGKRAAAR